MPNPAQSEADEEQAISIQLASKQFIAKLQTALEAVQAGKWDAAKDAVDTAEDMLTAYSYGYPDPTGLRKNINDAQAAIEDQDEDKALMALRAAVAAAHSPADDEEDSDQMAKASFAQAVAQARKDAGLSIDEASAKMPEDEPLEPSDWRKVEAGEMIPHDACVEAIAQVLDADSQRLKQLASEARSARRSSAQMAEEEPQSDAKSRLQFATSSDVERTSDGELLVTIMDTGQGNGFQWTADALRAGAPLFDGTTAFVNHERLDVAQQRPGRRVVDDICGVYYDPFYDPKTQAIRAKWRPMPPRGEWTGHILNAILNDREAGLPVPNIGISADVSFNHRHGQVTRLIEAHSADIVFDPARGPQAGEAFARIANQVQKELDMEDTQVQDAEQQDDTSLPSAAQPDNASIPTPPDATTDQTPGHQDATRSAGRDPSKPAPGDPQQALDHLTDNARLMLGIMAENILDSTCANSGLPPSAQARIRSAFEGQIVIDMDKLNTMIETERLYLASLVEDQVIQGMGAKEQDQPEPQPARAYLGGHTFRIQPGHSPIDRVRLAVDRWFGLPGDYADVPKIDMAQLYVDLTGDVSIRGLWDLEAAHERTGLANIDDTTFSDVVADSMNKVVLHNWQVMAGEGYDWWQKVVYEKDFDSLYDVEWVTYGGFGDLPKLSAGQEYPELSITDLDTSESAGPDDGDWVKPGGIISVPIETFDKGGPLGAFQGLPAALGVTAIRTLSGDVANIFTANNGVGPTLADGKALFHADHLNFATTAFGYTGWDEAIQDQFKQTEQNSDKRMGIRPWGILTPIELRGLGVQVLTNPAQHGTADRNVNAYQYAEERVLTPPEFIDANNWATFTNPKVYPAIGVGYRFGHKPEIVPEPGGQSSYGRFTQDAMRWKVFWFYTVSVINYRGLQKRNVAGG